VTMLSCTTETLGTSVPGSPLPPVPSGTTEPQASTTTPTTAVPLTLPHRPGATTAPAILRGDTVISNPPTTAERPLVLDEDVTPGPGDIDLMPASQVLDWRPLVSVWFRAADVDRVLHIIACESSGRWNAESKRLADNGMRAQGLMQHLDGYWSSRSKAANKAGYTNYGDIWSPSDQVAVSAWLAYNTPQGFGHWVCNEGET